MNRQYLLARRPQGDLQETDFEYRETPIPEPGEGEVLVRTLLISIDPANRVWMEPTPSYRSPLKTGEVMEGLILGEVVRSNVPWLKAGDLVDTLGGWQDYGVFSGKALTKREGNIPLTNWVSVLGITGKTAYFGLLDVGKLKEGDRVLVSAAAGATGSVVGQIAKLKGCKVIGTAGSEAKCAWLTDELGFDGAINYKTDDIASALDKHFPDGIDVYFDNVGGAMLQQAVLRMRVFGRIICCGAISTYQAESVPPGPHGIPGLVIMRRLRIEGFVIVDYGARFPEAEAALLEWVEQGKIKVREDVIEGLENAPSALMGLLKGENTGKRMVRVGQPS